MAVQTFDYVRVSTNRQVHDRQDGGLTGPGAKPEDIHRDKISGAKFVWVGLEDLLRTVREVTAAGATAYTWWSLLR